MVAVRRAALETKRKGTLQKGNRAVSSSVQHRRGGCVEKSLTRWLSYPEFRMSARPSAKDRISVLARGNPVTVTRCACCTCDSALTQ